LAPLCAVHFLASEIDFVKSGLRSERKNMRFGTI